CESDPKCCNCASPYTADERTCPARPTVKNGVITRLSKAALRTVRKARATASRLTNPT
ncbi:uncharacterized protein K452DRAFT_225439, partial [Aplosporella prunicola CBS 121167]